MGGERRDFTLTVANREEWLYRHLYLIADYQYGNNYPNKDDTKNI